MMWWYVGSLCVTLLAFIEILSSIGLGFFFYRSVLKLPHFPFMNLITIFLAIGIGADDVFVYVDCWRQSRQLPRSCGGDGTEHHDTSFDFNVARVTHSLSRAGMSTFATSFTTAAAFFANATTNIISVKCFGLFAGIVIICDYVLMITFLPAVVLYFDERICGSLEDEGDGAELAVPSAFGCFFDTFVPSLLLGNPSTERAASGLTSGGAPSNFPSTSGNRQWLTSSTIAACSWTLLLAGLGLYCVSIAFANPGLTLPAHASYQLFYDEHPFEIWDVKYSPMYSTASISGDRYRVEWWFGLDGTDDSNGWDPKSAGSTKTYPIDIYSKPSQIFFWQLAQGIESQAWWLSWEQVFIRDVRRFMEGSCSDRSTCCEYARESFPYNADEFKNCLNLWCR